jgi:hypothetical protein
MRGTRPYFGHSPVQCHWRWFSKRAAMWTMMARSECGLDCMSGSWKDDVGVSPQHGPTRAVGIGHERCVNGGRSVGPKKSDAARRKKKTKAGCAKSIYGSHGWNRGKSMDGVGTHGGWTPTCDTNGASGRGREECAWIFRRAYHAGATYGTTEASWRNWYVLFVAKLAVSYKRRMQTWKRFVVPYHM